jgi:tetratricopeptide (TPR) repeat protein
MYRKKLLNQDDLEVFLFLCKIFNHNFPPKTQMRKVILLLAVLFYSNAVFAQKIDLDKLNFKASYLQLPTNPFPEEYTTFSTKFIANGINLSDAGFANGESDLASTYFNISGFKKVNMGGHFTIKVQIDGYDMGKAETVKKENKTKDKDGKETITLSYTLTFKYLVPMMYTITDLNGKILQDGAITEGSKEKTYETSSYSTTAALEKYWNDNAATTRRGLLGGFISEKLSLLQARLENEIGYVPRTNTDILWTTDSPKHPENDAFKKACEDTKFAMAEMTAIVPLNRVKIKPIIAYFDSVLVKYTKDEKPDRKLRYGAWYNMSTIYYWLEDFDNAIRCSEGLIANDYDKGDGKDLKAASERLKAKLANGVIKTRHYVRDVSNAVAPEMTQAQRDEEEVRQNILKDKAMREAAEREVTSQRSSSGGNGMLDVDNSIKAIAGVLGGAKYREKQKIKEEIKELSKSLSSLNRELEKNKGSGDIEFEGDSKEDYVNNAQLLIKKEKYEGAVKSFTKALNLDANDADILAQRGIILAKNLRQYDNAIADFSKVIELTPTSIKGYNGKGFTYWMMGKYEQSIEHYRKLTEIEPQKPFAYSMICDMYNSLEKYEMAANTYSQLIKISPNGEYYNGRGWALSNAGKFKDAIPDFDKAIEFEPKNGIYFKNRGNAKNKIGQYESALQDLNIAVKKNTDLHHKSLSNRGDSYFGLGKYKEALENYEEALKVRSDFQEAIDGKQKAEAKLKN